MSGRAVQITIELGDSPAIRSIMLRALDLLVEVEEQKEPPSLAVARAAAELREAFGGKVTDAPFREVESAG